MPQVDPSLFAVAFVALLACGLSLASFVTSMRSSPARLQRESIELRQAWEAQQNKLQGVVNDNLSMREEWVDHRTNVAELLDAAVAAMETTEKRRRSARTERRRAEETREQEEPATYVCEQCRYEHLRGEDCMSCARRRLM